MDDNLETCANFIYFGALWKRPSCTLCNFEGSVGGVCPTTITYTIKKCVIVTGSVTDISNPFLLSGPQV